MSLYKRGTGLIPILRKVNMRKEYNEMGAWGLG